ncbi:hypothetical protein D3C76_1222060 [compost metagenome]
MQQAVYPVAQPSLIAARFKVNVAGALLDGVLQQPIDDVHDRRIIGAGLCLALAHVQQLFQLAEACRLLTLCALYRVSQPEHRLAHLAYLQRAGQHTQDRLAQATAQVGLPMLLVGLCAGDGDAVGIAGNDEDAVAPREGRRYQPVDLHQVELQRVDAQVRLADFAGEPLTQAVQVQPLAGCAAVFEVECGDGFQRVAARVCGGEFQYPVGIVGGQVLVALQGVQQ